MGQKGSVNGSVKAGQSTILLGMHLTPPWAWCKRVGVADVEDYPRTIASLESRYPQEGDCLDYLFALRWPDGFCCPNCTNGRAWRSSRGLWLCSGCRRQVSVLAGTVFQDTHLPMRTWFRAMWCITSQKNGMSALGLQ